jgi:hypothetical protein
LFYPDRIAFSLCCLIFLNSTSKVVVSE